MPKLLILGSRAISKDIERMQFEVHMVCIKRYLRKFDRAFYVCKFSGIVCLLSLPNANNIAIVQLSKSAISSILFIHSSISV